MKGPLFLGKQKLPSRILYAPLAGCSDYPFRQISCRYHPGIVYCEMVKMDALVRHDPHTYRLLDYHSSMHPIGAQLCGSKIKLAAQSAKMIEDLGFDVLDFNCGCPVDKVTKDGSGSGMLKTPDLIGEMIAEMVSSVKIPVTVKVRAGWDLDSINAPLITQIAEKAGAKAIAIHGRTRAQGYKGPANWDFIKACKDVAQSIFVIGNGDVFSAEAALKMFAYTGCDAVLVSRGTLGQPWIAEDASRALSGLDPLPRPKEEIRNVMLEHFHAIIRYQNERQSLLDFRRVGCWYLKRCIGAKELRIAINKAATTSEAMHLLEGFNWDAISLASDISFAETE